jgi:hypothetical protein
MSSLWKLDDFKAVIEAVFKNEPRAILMGGQACNFYSLYYIEEDESLRNFLPFTSHDIDIYTPNQTAPEAAAAQLHASLQKAPRGTPSPVMSAMTWENAHGEELLVQFMRGAYGVKTEDLVDAAIEYEIFDCHMRVMHPVYLLQSKINCLKGLNQKGRQDKKHVSMTICFCACFLHSLIENSSSSVEEEKASITACQHSV